MDGGGHIEILDSVRILFMAGRSLSPIQSGQPTLVGYVGMQFLINRAKENKKDDNDHP